MWKRLPIELSWQASPYFSTLFSAITWIWRFIAFDVQMISSSPTISVWQAIRSILSGNDLNISPCGRSAFRASNEMSPSSEMLMHMQFMSFALRESASLASYIWRIGSLICPNSSRSLSCSEVFIPIYAKLLKTHRPSDLALIIL